MLVPKENEVLRGILVILLGMSLFCFLYLLIAEDNMKAYYRGGAGIVYRQQVINITDNTTYSVDHEYMDMGDDNVGLLITFHNLDKWVLENIALWFIPGLILLGGFMLVVTYLRQMELIG